MLQVKLEDSADGMRVDTGAYTFEHRVPQGGACVAIVPVRGGSGNLLRGPLAGAIRTLSSDGTTRIFRESFDTQARLRHEEVNGVAAVIAEGVFRDEAGQTIPVGFRRRTEYHASGQIWTTLEVMSDCGCPDVIELSGASIMLRRGMTHCAVKLHPTQAGGADLLGAGAEFALAPNTTAFLTRFTPLQMQCLDRAGEGIAVFPGELASWDYACKSDLGLGFYRVAEGANGTQLDWMPYCLAQRRITTVLQGKIALRLGLAPAAPKSRLSARVITAAAGDEALRALAAAGTTVVSCPVEGEADAEQLRILIDTAHANGLKIVAGISAHELPASAPEFARHGSEWMHMAAPSLGMIRTWRGATPAGGLMCLQSGWLEHLKRHIDVTLSALPWDGVCLEHAAAYPCCHPGHGRAFHSEIEGLLQLLAFCRERAGAAGIVLTDGAAPRSLAVEQFTDGVARNNDD